MSKLGTPQKIVGGAAVAYVIWAFIPGWYSCCTVNTGFGDFGANVASANGFRFPVMLAWLCAVIALVGVVLMALGQEMKMQVKPGTVQLGIAGVGLLFTLLGLVAKPTGFSISWALFVGIVIAAVWAYGGYMWHSQPEGSGPPASGGGGFSS